MAGRPLRRLRRLELLGNPLVGWEDLSGTSPAKAEPPFVVLVKSGAEAKYKEVYNRVDLPLAVVLRESRWDGDRGSRLLHLPETRPGKLPMSEQSRRAVKQHKEDAALAQKLNAVLLVVSVPGRDGPQNEPRGSADRVSPYTPFVLLHRIGDFLRQVSSETTGALRYRLGLNKGMSTTVTAGELAKAGKYLRDIKKKRLLAHGDEDLYEVIGEDPVLLSKGVDTAAGRMGVLVDVDSDLFAKWLLTGRFAYNPDSPPSETREEQVYRSTLASNLPRVFHLWHTYLRRSAPSVFYI